MRQIHYDLRFLTTVVDNESRVNLYLLGGLILRRECHAPACFHHRVALVQRGFAQGNQPSRLPAHIVELLLALQNLAVVLGDRLEAVDINPVMLGAAGAVAVDALVVPPT